MAILGYPKTATPADPLELAQALDNDGTPYGIPSAAAAQRRWRKVNAPHFVRLLRAGVRFKDGKIVLSASLKLPDAEAEGLAACSP